jgi:hypothetical protein
MLMGAPRRSLVAALAAGSLLLTGCAGPTADAEAGTPSASSSPIPSPWSQKPKLPPPPRDAAVVGPLSRAALPPPPGFVSPKGGEGAGRTGPFTIRSYVRDFYGGDKQVRADLELGRLVRGYHRFATTTNRGGWMHVYLFESEDNYGATSLKSMLFGSTTADSYEVKLIEGALGHVERNKRDEGGRYTMVEIAFVTGNVYARVILASRAKKVFTRVAERLALAQHRRLQKAMSKASTV